MTTRARNGKARNTTSSEERVFRLAPLARAIALTIAAGGIVGTAHAQRAFSPAWFAAKGTVQQTAVQTGKLPNGLPASSLHSPAGQQQKANETLQRSINNLNLAARGIAAQQAAQAAARAAAGLAPFDVPEGLAEGGLKVDTNSLTAGWLNAKDPTQTVADGRTTVTIGQTAGKAILNWETFNVGRNTTVNFDQATYDAAGNRTAQTNWAVLNKVNDPNARPSQIQGQIKADGTVMIVNRNGIVFNGTSQVNTRNLVAAAANITDPQFNTNGIYGANGTAQSFTNAGGNVLVEAGAQLRTAAPTSVTQGGGYVLLLGKEVRNAGEITTARGQVQLAAGDSFVIRKGYATDGNTWSTTRGNEVSPQISGQAGVGLVKNTGLLLASEGDVTLAGHDLRQSGVAVATTTVNQRGTVHLLNSAKDATGSVTLGANSVTAVVLQDDGSTALDSQRSALLKDSVAQDTLRASANVGLFDNLSVQADRRDQSRVEIVSGNMVDFAEGSLTLATGGQVAAGAVRRVQVEPGATLDVSGLVGVQLAMSSNNLQVNIQGNEQRDAPANRDTGKLNNADVWVDTRRLLYVPAGAGGYADDRFYTSGGLLEVSGYLGTQGHTVGQWAAAGGTVTLSGSEVVTRAGAMINLAGGSYDVSSGTRNVTWLRGDDGRLYTVDDAPAGVVFSGLYKGFEDAHARWGAESSRFFRSPLIAPERVFEAGYTVGRDAGRLIVSSPTLVLDGALDTSVYQGPRQSSAAAAAQTDSYQQSQFAVARPAGLAIGLYNAQGLQGGYASDVKIGSGGVFDGVLGVADALPEERLNTAWLDAATLNAAGLGALTITTTNQIRVDAPLALSAGGALRLFSPVIEVASTLTARGGSMVLETMYEGGDGKKALLTSSTGASPTIRLQPGAMLDTRGLWVNTLLDPAGAAGLAYLDGGDVMLDSSGLLLLSAGSTIDVSSGGAVLSKDKTRGGKGGDVTLIAGDPYGGGGVASNSPENALHGLMTLDGAIRSYGVDGGGTLKVDSTGNLLIGDVAELAGGKLAAGTPAPVALKLAEPLTVAAGQPLPMKFSVTYTDLPLDTPAPAAVTLQTPKVPSGAAWKLPPGLGAITTNPFGFYFSGDTLPANSNVIGWTGSLAVGGVIPSSVFPGGVAITPFHVDYAAGSASPTDTVYAVGTDIARGQVLPQTVAITPAPALRQAFFEAGFSKYDLTGGQGVIVARNVRITPVMPVYRFTADSVSAPSGSDASAGLSTWLPPLYTENPAAATLTQRGGASLSLHSTSRSMFSIVDGGGVLQVGAGAILAVDPGQSIALDAFEQLTVDGSLIAHGGNITLSGAAIGDQPTSRNFDTAGNNLGRSLWLGENAVLDVSGQSYGAHDRYGRVYGKAADGGAIALNGATDFVVLRPGAELNADGAALTVDGAAWQNQGVAASPVTLAGNGGSISFNSGSGLYLDGDFHAHGAGEGAAGGTLSVVLQSLAFVDPNASIPFSVRQPSTLAVTQAARPSALTAQQVAGEAGDLAFGHGAIGVDQIQAGGFNTLTLDSTDFLQFDGDVALSLARSVSLNASSITSGASLIRFPEGQTPVLDSLPAAVGSVRIAAPYIHLHGNVWSPPDGTSSGAIGNLTGTSPLPTDTSFELDAGLLDVDGLLDFGGRSKTWDATTFTNYILPRPGFKTVRLVSQADIRFTPTDAPNGTVITSLWDVALQAAQIYPTSDTRATVYAGRFNPGYAATLTVGRTTDNVPEAPMSAFGSLSLSAPVIEQGGILRAPFGALQLGLDNDLVVTRRVELLPGSLTSVSMNGLIVPYGGTVDGVTYSYNGKELGTQDLTNWDTATIKLSSQTVDVQDGATLDLSGGGTLAGAGFISGRGGSVNVLTTPLANANPAYAGSQAGNKVYALLPGYAADYAPVARENGAGDPAIGQQVTLATAVGGLPAGTYTLLPSNYALLPGAYRVELGKTLPSAAPRVIALSDGSYAASGYLGLAGTGVRASLPTQLLVTPSSVVRTYSQYSEQSYSAFQIARAQQFGGVRTQLPEDGKALQFWFQTPTQTGSPALSFNGKALLQAAEGGYPGLVGTRNVAEIYADAPTLGFTGVSVSDEALNAIGAPRLLINSAFQISDGRIKLLQSFNSTNDLIVRDGVSLAAGEIMLTGSNVTVGRDVTLSTVGRGGGFFDSASLGMSYDPWATTLAVSNGQLDFITTATGGTGAISVGAGSSLYGEGTLAFATQGQVILDSAAHFGARDINLAVNSLNVGDAQAIAAAGSPAGTRFDQSLLDILLHGDPLHGAPALQRLTLTAGSAINLFGPAQFSTRGSGVDLRLNTSAIYGVGGAGDQAVIAADRILWNGIPGASAPAIVAGGPGTGSGTLVLDADEIALGQFAPLNTSSSRRTVYGFANVDLNAAQRIVSSGNSALYVYQLPSADSGTVFGKSGNGGNLTLRTAQLTGEQKSITAYQAGGALGVVAPQGVVPSTASSTVAGAEIALSGDSVTLDSTILLPSGKLTVDARHDIALLGGSSIDLRGLPSRILNATVYGFGGDALFTSAQGGIAQAAGSVIDVSATQASAGTIGMTAGSGAVALDGAVLGAADNGHVSGSFSVKAATLADFAGVNARLTQGGLLQARSFTLTTGDLAIGDGVKAHDVNVSVDNGSLIVNGTIDASGVAPGTIRLSAKNGLTLTGSSVLDVHGTVLQADSYGQPIAARNRGHIELAANAGTLTLARGATLDLSIPDGEAYGDVQLYAPRTALASGDIAIDAAGSVKIRGASSVALNAMWTYDLPGGSVIDQAALAGYDLQSQAFIATAYRNDPAAGVLTSGLQGKLGGLLAQGGAFHLRPGVQISSRGDLSTSGDIDLSAYRYGSHAVRDAASARYGAGEPMYLAIRTAGNLDIKGSLSDGFHAVPGVPGVYADIDVAGSGLFQRYTNSSAGQTYTFWQNSATVVYTGQDWVVPTGGFYEWWLNDWWGTLLVDTSGRSYLPGMLVPKGTAFNPRSAGNDGAIAFDPNNMPVLQIAISPPVPGLPATSPQGAMLAAGSLSASLRLVAGADLGAADTRALQSVSDLAGSGNLRLNDPGYTAAKNGTYFSVLRTGTGSLDLLAGGNFSEASPYGVYTAGTQSAAILGADGRNPYDLQGLAGQGHAWYPEQGGDVLLQAGQDVRGFIQTYNGSQRYVDSDLVSNWLWRQGAGLSNVDPTAWWINFGASASTNANNANYAGLIGFQGIGTLGGGNLTVIAGRDAGVTDSAVDNQSSGLDLAVASTGRVLADGTLVQTGGGNLVLKVGGLLNGLPATATPSSSADYFGALTALRGDIAIRAGGVGSIAANVRSTYWTSYDPRALDVQIVKRTVKTPGPVVLPGDGSVVIDTRGDLVLGGAGDAGMTLLQDTRGLWYTPVGASVPVRGAQAQFSLWRPQNAIALYSAGGDVAPLTGSTGSANGAQNSYGFYPGILRVAAANGDIRFGDQLERTVAPPILELMPSEQGQLDLLAAGTIYGSGQTVAMSGADPVGLATPRHALVSIGGGSNATQDAAYRLDPASPLAFGEDTPSDALHANDPQPARVYAGLDIDDLALGQKKTVALSSGAGFRPTHTTWYVAAKPFEVIAGRDIAGTGPTPSVFMNLGANDITEFHAGRDIFQQSIVIAGPGLLDVQAGRSLYHGFYGLLDSVGPLFGVNAAGRDGGASIAVSVGAGASGPDYADFARRYFDAANQADLTAGHPLADQPGKVAHAYDQELYAWLQARFGYAGMPADALAYFLALPTAQQGIFVRQVYYAELTAGGREYNDVTSARHGSYLRGRQAIAALFPVSDAQGNAVSYDGDLTMFSGTGTNSQGATVVYDAGIHTQFGGDVQILNPGGRTLIGIEGMTPGAGAGLITQGSGDIQVYSASSILLGQSRIMTTFGGSILAWSATGDINAGRGAKTTVVYTPPRRVYDDLGNVTLSPQVPATGAGIATLNPISEVPPGDVDLIAPLGTIDAGEAGIRFSGNANFAALQVVNAANIKGEGKVTGIPMVAAVNVGALTNASAAASQAASAAQDVMQRERASARQNLPSIFTVRVLGFGNEQIEGGGDASPPRSDQQSGALRYDPKNRVQYVGHGQHFNPDMLSRLTPDERRLLQQDR